MKTALKVAAIGALLVGAGILNTANADFETSTTLPACEFEDSTNCYWDAETRGNGTGTSFVNSDWDVLRYDQYTYIK